MKLLKLFAPLFRPLREFLSSHAAETDMWQRCAEKDRAAAAKIRECREECTDIRARVRS